MDVWEFVLVTAVGITAFIIIISLLSSLLITWFARKHSEKTMDAHIIALERMLPGKNCGACGCETCAEYARAVFTCRMDTDCCTQGPEDLSRRMNARMEKFMKELEDDTPKKEDVEIY